MFRAICPECKKGIIIEEEVGNQLVRAGAQPGDLFPHICPSCGNSYLQIPKEKPPD